MVIFVLVQRNPIMSGVRPDSILGPFWELSHRLLCVLRCTAWHLNSLILVVWIIAKTFNLWESVANWIFTHKFTNSARSWTRHITWGYTGSETDRTWCLSSWLSVYNTANCSKVWRVVRRTIPSLCVEASDITFISPSSGEIYALEIWSNTAALKHWTDPVQCLSKFNNGPRLCVKSWVGCEIRQEKVYFFKRFWQ